ncbi:MAG: acyl-CoA/acyl-ACP dehydrogenase [Candidatus Binatia bacterium]|nr:acyl-CoA/acyl-ACP dehydrogenase [Candidatus Binatia bacterium]
MDLTLDENQSAIVELARKILEEKLPPDRLRAIERSDEWFARDVWAELASAGLIGVALPESDGGGGFGVLEACLLLEEIGRAVAPLPYQATVMLGALPLAEFGSDAQRARDLPGVIAGDVVLTGALLEPGEPFVPAVLATKAVPEGEGYRLDGEKWFVPFASAAQRMLVPASTDGGVTVFLVDPAASGVSLERVETTSHEPQWAVTLDGALVAKADVLGEADKGQAIVDWMIDRAIAGTCSMQAGVSDKALRLTAAHVSEREQFGQKIATFQAVAQRAADAYVDTQGIVLTSRQAAWRLGAGEDAATELAIAKYWAADAGQRVAHAAQHLHGGIGVDTDYPLHRYFRWTKVLELTLGGAAVHLDRIGAELAR